MLNWLWQRILNILSWVVTFTGNTADAAWQFALDFMQAAGELALRLMPEEVAEYFNGLDFSAATDAMAPIAYLIPLPELLLIVVTTYSLVGLIRLTRWLLACIPLVNLG